MRTMLLVAALALVAGGLLSATPAMAHCAGPPCGPIPVVLEMKTNGEQYATFGSESQRTFEGTISVYVNVDGDGFWYDPERKPVITFKVTRQPPWVAANVEPNSYEVPVDDPQFLKSEGSPDQVQFYWEAPIKITVKKVRDPTSEEIGSSAASNGVWSTSQYIRRDGSYRVVVAASSSASILAQDVLGPTNGLQEGYGVKDLRFIPEIAGVAWVPDASGVLQPGGKVPDAKGTSPGLAGVATFVVGAVVALAVGRRRH